MKPINGYIVCKRDNKITGIGDIIVGENAYADNPEATVVNIGAESISGLKVGDTVHLPHYGTMYDEYKDLVILKAENVIGKKVDGKYVPINGNIRVRKCVNDHLRDEKGEIALYMTENHIEHTHWCEIIDVSEDCKWVGKNHIGYYCQAPESSEGLQRIKYSKDYMLKESELEFITDGE